MKQFVVFLLILISLPFATKAQGLNSDGKDFYVGLLYPSFMEQNLSGGDNRVQGFYGAYLLISSYYGTSVTVSYFDDAGNEAFQQSYKVAARRAISVPLDIAHTKMTDRKGEVVEYKACHIVASSTINVQYFSTGACAGGSYLAIATPTLGKNYIVESYHDNPGGVGGVVSNEDAAGYFMVIGAFDGTTVQITPNTTTAKGHHGVNSGAGSNGTPQPFQINLNRGQCYMMKSTAGDTDNDISGSRVISSKPVAVIAGHENAHTDGSWTDAVLDSRNYMVQQMLPCQYWDTTGYVSIPFVDSKQPASSGQGDEYHVFTCSPTGANITMNSNIQVGVSLATSLYPNPVPSKIGVTTPVNFYETLPDGKFHVVQYDQRMHGGGAPYPAPNQMNVIPISRWKTSYLWSVPANTVQVLQGYFINLICRAADYNSDNIQVAVNGGKLSSIRSGGFSLRKVWGAGTIPDHPELMGLTYALGPSSYYVTNISQSPDAGLMIYNYGFRGIDADGDIGDFDKDDFFFAYASPVGFVSGKTENTTITATVDTLCAKWHICAHVSGKNQPGIKQITILDDPNGDLVRPAKKYSNVQFDLTVDPNNTREIDLDGNTADYCFDVDVKNPFDTAYCPLYIVDNTGNSTIIELRYTSPKLRVAYSPKEIRNGYDSVIYPVTGIGSKSCATIYYINNGDSAKGDPNIAISSATLKHQNSAFAITNTVPSLPASLGPKSSSKPNGDTLAITICFDSKDTAFHLDSLLVTSACLVAPYTLAGQGGTPLIYASDHNFGSAAIGVSKCDTVSVTNVGNLPFTLSKDFVLHDSVNFSIVPSSLAQLPKVLNPGEKISLQFCFTPTVVGLISTKVDWVTDIAVPYVNSIKSFSILNSGNVVRPGLYWDTTTTTINADSTVVPVTGVGRVFLENRQTADAYVIVVRITGPDASEFELGQNQAGYDPLERFPIRANGSIWIDLLFKPDMTKPQPARSAHRFATLTAIYNKNPSGTITDSTVMQLIGGFDTLRLGVKIQPINTVSKLTAFVQEKRLVVILPNDQQDKLSLELYDLLGRKVSDWNAAEQYKIDNRLMLPIPTVASGTYIVRLKTATGQSSCVVIAQ